MILCARSNYKLNHVELRRGMKKSRWRRASLTTRIHRCTRYYLNYRIKFCSCRIIPVFFFLSSSPYKWRSGVNVLKRNSIRLAEVWLDEYAKYYYQRIGDDKVREQTSNKGSNSSVMSLPMSTRYSPSEYFNAWRGRKTIYVTQVNAPAFLLWYLVSFALCEMYG